MNSQQHNSNSELNNHYFFESPLIQEAVENLILKISNFVDEDFDIEKANSSESELNKLVVKSIDYCCEECVNGKLLSGLINSIRHGDEE